MKTFKPAADIKVGDITAHGEVLAIEYQRGLFGTNEVVFFLKQRKRRGWVHFSEEKEIEITNLDPLFPEN